MRQQKDRLLVFFVLGLERGEAGEVGYVGEFGQLVLASALLAAALAEGVCEETGLGVLCTPWQHGVHKHWLLLVVSTA